MGVHFPTCRACKHWTDDPKRRDEETGAQYCLMGKNTSIIISVMGHCTRYYEPLAGKKAGGGRQ